GGGVLGCAAGGGVGPGFETSGGAGVGAPKDTPGEIINTLNREINAALADPAVQARISNLGGLVLALSPSAYASLIAQETDKWAKVIKFAGAKAESCRCVSRSLARRARSLLLDSSACPLGNRLMHSEEPLRCFNLGNFGPRVEADEGRNE